ncbi:MAG: hypothetical protein ABJO09_01100 [Hyphomicrobiales bacterium]
MDLMTAISATTAALGLVKELRAIDTQIDQAELKLKLAEIIGAMADAKLALVDATEVIQGKDSEIEKLTKFLAFRTDNIVRQHGMYYDKEDDEPRGWPYCTMCFESGSSIKLAEDRSKAGLPLTCPKCKSSFGHVTRYKESKSGR